MSKLRSRSDSDPARAGALVACGRGDQLGDRFQVDAAAGDDADDDVFRAEARHAGLGRGQRGGDGRRARALGHDVRALPSTTGARPPRRRPEPTSASMPSATARSNIDSSTVREPIPSTNDGSNRPRPARPRAVRRRAVRPSRPRPRTPGPGPAARRDSAGETAAAPGCDDRRDGGQVLDDLQRDRRVSGHHHRVVERVDEDAVDAVEPPVDERLPPRLGGHAHHPGAVRLHRVDLRGGRGRRHDHRARHAEPAANHAAP